jgi:arginase
MPADASQPVAVIGAPLDLGQGRRGVDMGPSAIRYAGLDMRLTEIGRRVEDRGNVETAVAEAAEVGEPNARYLLPVLRTCERVAALVRRTAEAGAVPLVLGGDHSVAIGSIGGLAAAYGSGGVLWLDAHGDLNTPETSPTGNVHGMVLAAVLGLGGPVFESAAWPTPAIDPERVALVGVRSLDEGERERVRSLGAKVFTMSDVDRLGVERAIRESLAHIAGPGFVHVSLDMDVVDPEVAPGVGTPVRGGLSYREAHLLCEMVAESGRLVAIDLVELNPTLDIRNHTAEVGAELILSALGLRIL